MTTDEPRILVIEDEVHIANFLRRGLILQGYAVRHAPDGLTGLVAARTEPFDLILLDLMLPDMDGVTVCGQIRSVRTTPIIILTARDTITDRIVGLDAGADDYVVKPFNFDELLARVRAALRRESARRDGTLSAGPLELQPGARLARVNGKRLDLAPREYDLLEFLVRRVGEAVPRAEILARVWGLDFATDSHVLAVYIGYIRRKMEAAGAPDMIRSVRGVGYALDVPDDVAAVASPAGNTG